MGSITKQESHIFGLMFALQLALLMTVQPLVAALAPPLLAAVPMGYAATRSDQTCGMMKRRLFRAYVSASILTAVAVALLLFSHDLSFRLLVARALLTDVAILWFATAIAVDLRTRGEART